MNLSNIVADEGCYRVKLQREGMIYRVYVPFGKDKAAALRHAMAERDRFLALLGPVRPRSNTGRAGICEMTKWNYGRPYPCFTATTGGTRRRRMRRFFYHNLASRDRALESAAQWRQQHQSHA